SLSKRSNMAGVRAGFYAGDAELVNYLRECRKHAGCMVPGPVQAAAVAAWSDQVHVDEQAARYRRRLSCLACIAGAAESSVSMPGGAFYLWAPAPAGDSWAFADMLARRAGLIVSPGEFYCEQPDRSGPHDPRHFVRMAAVQPLKRLELAKTRLLAAVRRG
ncbi:MAG: aminotransferase class I/II-fold pyridoxal phosphate-dependent enzyme, partial [Acidimicrobiaceae bacterium]|nr:aminotransferase class I/II-fold pyridoxal phosphate-dependent enzyme [Acidimicrobiaceae bacterium]